MLDADLVGNPWDRAALVILMTIGACVLWRRPKRTMRILRLNLWLVALFCYMVLSAAWSNFPGITLRRSLRSIGAFEMVLVVLTEADHAEAVSTLLRRLYMAHIPLSIVAIKYVRRIGVSYTWDGLQEMWVGLSVHKNNLGQVAMCSGLLSSWRVVQNWKQRKLTADLMLLAMTLWVLGGSKTNHSSTAILGFVVGAAVLAALQIVKRRAAQAKRIVLRNILLLAAIAPILYATFHMFRTDVSGIVLEATGRDVSLTDRTAIWADVLDNAAKSPILGVGFGGFWVGPAGYALYPFPHWALVTHTWRPTEGHNGYIDVYVDVGVIGLALTLIVIWLGITGALQDMQTCFGFGSLRLTLLVAVLVNNAAESSLLNGTHSLWFVFLLAAVRLPDANRVARPRRMKPAAIWAGVASECRLGTP